MKGDRVFGYHSTHFGHFQFLIIRQACGGYPFVEAKLSYNIRPAPIVQDYVPLSCPADKGDLGGLIYFFCGVGVQMKRNLMPIRL